MRWATSQRSGACARRSSRSAGAIPCTRDVAGAPDVHCPFCNHDDTKVTDSRLAGEGHQIRRRRECLSCGERFTTFETAELVMPLVVKSDHSRAPFDEAKLRAGMERALQK